MSQKSELYIKNMVCQRCLYVVEHVARDMGLPVCHVEMGRVCFDRDLTDAEQEEYLERLRPFGFDILVDQVARQMALIKQAVIEHTRHCHGGEHKLPEHVADALNLSYKYLSQLFSEREHRTIEQYYLTQRIEYAKELLGYGELTVSEIAYRLGFADTAHFTRQFKKMVYMTPTEYRRQSASTPRAFIDQI